jgi:hypothetical protein
MKKITESDILKTGSYLYPRKIPKKVTEKWIAEIKQKQQECLDIAKINYDLLRIPMDI